MTVLVPLDSQSRRIEIRLQTAFGHEPFLLRQMECSFLAASDQSRLARGAVGQLASQPSQVAECLRNIVDHYDHHANTAARVRRRVGSDTHSRPGAARFDPPGVGARGRPAQNCPARAGLLDNTTQGPDASAEVCRT